MSSENVLIQLLVHIMKNESVNQERDILFLSLTHTYTKFFQKYAHAWLIFTHIKPGLLVRKQSHNTKTKI